MKLVFDKFKVWGLVKKKEVGWVLFKLKLILVVVCVVVVNKFKKLVKGDEKLLVEKWVYFYVEVEVVIMKVKILKGEFYYFKDWVVGRLLDVVVKSF